MTQTLTKVNQEHKVDLIEHINNDHIDELQDIALAYSSHKNILSVTLDDVFEEGCLLAIETTTKSFQEIFVPFTIKGDIEEKVWFLAYEAMIKNGKPLTKTKKQYFEVINTKSITKNMLRLYVKSAISISKNKADAYLFSLKKLAKKGRENSESKKITSFTKLYGKLLLFTFKILSSKQRSSLLRSMNKNNRYYTIRKTWKEGKEYFGFVDIYIHGNTNGSNWASNLQQGDIVYSLSHYKEKTQHLNKGKALLIADETSLPAVGAILEQWTNPVAPEVIVVTNDKEEELYLNEVENKSYNAHYISNSENLHTTIIQTLEKLDGIETVWGGLEKDISRELKKYFRNTLNIESKNNRVIGYWKNSEIS